MSFSIKKDKKKREKEKDKELEDEECKNPCQKYNKKCNTNSRLLENENKNRLDLTEHPDDNAFL
jgi:hypothetical protein